MRDVGVSVAVLNQSSAQAPSTTQTVLDWFAGQPAAVQARWHADIQHQLRENGASFELWQTPTRQLDLYPWLLDDVQWQFISCGIQQRHRLLALILADLYGPQRLLQHNIIPAELVFRSGSFLPECHAIVTQPEQWLPLLATDIGLTTKGHFCAFSDSCKVPAGLGFALEHRLALKQNIPELQQLYSKQQLAGFFRTLRHHLQQQPGLTAILTHGKRDAAYFEQAYLANYLDVALVHGADLMLTEERLWLKTLSGLKPVGAILRYLDDRQSDPLALDQIGGVAGLLHCIRQQQVLCANPIGSGLLDTGILLPYMDAAADFLLHEPLSLPSVPAYWCGQANSVLDTLEHSTEHYLMHDISTEQQTIAQPQQIAHRPADFILRQRLALQLHPTYQKHGPVLYQPAVLRTFSLQQQNANPLLLPGAFARVGDLTSIQLPHTAYGNNVELSKDVWVLGEEQPVESLLQSSYSPVILSRESGLLPSRVADHLFWLGRYNERLNLLARALRVALPLLNLRAVDTDEQALLCFINFCLTANGGKALNTSQAVAGGLEQLFSPANPLSVIALLRNLVYNAQSVREYFSDDTWYLLDKLQATLYQWPAQPNLQHPKMIIRLLDEVVLLQTAIYGLNNETMSRTQALRFMDIGQHLERASQTSALLEHVFVHVQPDAQLMEALLRMADTLMTYRRRYRSELNPIAIIDLLLLDTSTPRSVGYQISRLRQQTAELPELTTADRQRLPALADALAVVITELSAEQLYGEQYAMLQLADQLQHIQQLLRRLSDELSLCYFTHAHLSRPWVLT